MPVLGFLVPGCGVGDCRGLLRTPTLDEIVGENITHGNGENLGSSVSRSFPDSGAGGGIRRQASVTVSTYDFLEVRENGPCSCHVRTNEDRSVGTDEVSVLSVLQGQPPFSRQVWFRLCP